MTFAGSTSTSSKASEAPQPGYELEQKSMLFGKFNVRIYPKAIQFTDEGQGLIYVSRAPAWNVTIINPIAKTYYESKLQDFTGSTTRGITLLTGKTLTDATYEKEPKREPDGRLHFTTDEQYIKRESELKNSLSNRGNGLPKKIDVWTDPKITTAPPAVSLASRIYGFAEAKGMPVTIDYYDFDNDKKPFLTTTRTTKKLFTDNDFGKRDSGYQRVANPSAVTRTAARDDAVGELLEGLNGMAGTKPRR